MQAELETQFYKASTREDKEKFLEQLAHTTGNNRENILKSLPIKNNEINTIIEKVVINIKEESINTVSNLALEELIESIKSNLLFEERCIPPSISEPTNDKIIGLSNSLNIEKADVISQLPAEELNIERDTIIKKLLTEALNNKNICITDLSSPDLDDDTTKNFTL